MSKHTPGPWEVIGAKICTVGNDKERIAVARVQTEWPLYEQGEANARLIAAAPDMLEALELLLKHEGETEVSGIGTEHDSDNLEIAKAKARAAIAKAEGR